MKPAANKSVLNRARYLTACLVVSEVEDVELQDLLQRRQGPIKRKMPENSKSNQANKTCFAPGRIKGLSLYLANTVFNIPQIEVARAAGIAKQTVNEHCRAIEELRDDPEYDQRVEAYEERLREVSA